MLRDYSEIRDLVEAGKSAGKTDPQINADAAKALNSDPRTVRNVPIGKARQLLVTEWGLVYKWGDSYLGPLAELYHALPADDPKREPVRKLITHLLDNPSAVEIDLATNAAYAGAFFELLDNPTLGLTPGQMASLEALHGGRKFAGVTEADVAACRLQHESRQRYRSAMSACLAAIDAGASIADCRAAMIGGWDDPI